MLTTTTLDDDLWLQAQQISGLTDRAQLIREALLALIERETAKRLAKLDQTQPELQQIPCRQSEQTL
ncbi:MAG: type II toxin-antitoxin system VapB family antitoxin [Methylomonas sp.]